jgi:hypothetical protein
VVRYRDRKARRLILDTKPRYQAEWRPDGTSARRLYRRWDHGAKVRGSCVVTNAEDMKSAFSLGYSTVIAQADSDLQIPALVRCCREFLEGSRRGQPQLLQVDETCDFFHGNGMPIGDASLVKAARAGAERGTACLFCSQRTKGISAHLLEHMTKLYAFCLDVADDAKRFREFGCPIGPGQLPTEPYRFLYWTKQDRSHIWGPYQLAR